MNKLMNKLLDQAVFASWVLGVPGSYSPWPAHPPTATSECWIPGKKKGLYLSAHNGQPALHGTEGSSETECVGHSDSCL